MKLAEALSHRAQLNIKISQLKSRLSDCIKIQEGDELTESPEQVVEELDKTLSEFRSLVYRINMTNATTMTEGRNITSLLAERDALVLRVKTLNDALRKITEPESRYTRAEIKFIRTIDVKQFRSCYEESAAELRRLDLTIQSLGFTTELIE